VTEQAIGHFKQTGQRLSAQQFYSNQMLRCTTFASHASAVLVRFNRNDNARAGCFGHQQIDQSDWTGAHDQNTGAYADIALTNGMNANRENRSSFTLGMTALVWLDEQAIR
jgi:hypothetical protein